jgi:PAS domain S-box-containing protein
MAWVGTVEHDPAKRVRPVAISGDDRGYLARFPVSWSPDDLPGQGPTGRSIRSGSVQATRDIYADLSGEWAAAARARGYVGACSIPLKVRGEVVGVLMMYAGEALELHEEEVSLLGDVGDDLSYGIAAIRDRAAMTAQQSELKLFREVMERSTDAIYLLDADTARIIDFNETALRSLGYTAEELRALGPKDIASDVPDDAAWRRRSEDVRSGAVSTRRTTHRRKDGTTYPVDVSLTAIETAGRRVMLSVARDITDRVRAEEESERLQAQFLRAQRMESVGRLAGGVAHDFNNLLTVINGTADLALADLPPDSAVRSDLQEIRAAGNRAAALTRQLLAFSRQQVLHPEHLDLNEVVPAFLGMLKRVIGEDIDVEVRLASVAAHVLADHGQLEQVLMNLCVNARDAMPNGGRLTLGVDLVNVDAATAAEIPTMRPGPAVRLAISDTGEGMSPELQLRIFEPFFTTKEAGRGTGLGLSTVYGIVKQSGGHLGVTSRPGKGTTFTIYLPVALPPAVPGPAAPRPKQATGTETILVVEDEEAIRFVVRRVLERSGYKVLEAATGADALAVIAAHDGPLDLVMTDLVMPGMSGIDLARMLRREHPSLRILLASGYSQETVSNEFDKAREWHLISKPYAVNDLLAELRRILDGAEPSSLGGRPPA